MMAVISILVFTGAFALSAGVIAVAIGPQWRRIVRLAAGQVEQGFSPLGQLAMAERRIAVRRWASAPVPAPIRRMREAA
ncbi:hypothetical protein [Sphingomonas rubra]|uniref:Uncharacterized protein n=1 Tax=Sphingomonas rubra TaxID=634430 RepID=A0A1I5PX59_9SPHN|nr:hypothetical protein [Sphingomonas rubra]SFP38625.1 hypothetical protein SAMN04488241_101297 [Sphingomonas rubra]